MRGQEGGADGAGAGTPRGELDARDRSQVRLVQQLAEPRHDRVEVQVGTRRQAAHRARTSRGRARSSDSTGRAPPSGRTRRSPPSASASPARAAACTCSPRTSCGSPPASSTTAAQRRAVAASRASIASPDPDAYRSQQPRRPHGQRGPSGRRPCARTRRRNRSGRAPTAPLATSPPPIPVPSVTRTMSRSARARHRASTRRRSRRWRRCRRRSASTLSPNALAQQAGDLEVGDAVEVRRRLQHTVAVDEPGDADPERLPRRSKRIRRVRRACRSAGRGCRRHAGSDAVCSSST